MAGFMADDNNGDWVGVHLARFVAVRSCKTPPRVLCTEGQEQPVGAEDFRIMLELETLRQVPGGELVRSGETARFLLHIHDSMELMTSMTPALASAGHPLMQQLKQFADSLAERKAGEAKRKAEEN